MTLALGLIIYLAVAILIALFLRRYVFIFIRVDGRSMMNTLNNEEILYVRRYTRKYGIKRFDVVICRFPGNKRMFLKRIIALPNETISMEDDIVFINGEPLIEKFDRRKCIRKLEPVVLAEDEYFLMGDNRPVSKDSRRMGPVKRERIYGRAVFVLFPWKKRREIH